MKDKLDVNLEIVKLLRKFFEGDDEKVDHWLNANNANFGGSSPSWLMLNGRSDKVLLFIKDALDN
jgi:hypothetical protein